MSLTSSCNGSPRYCWGAIILWEQSWKLNDKPLCIPNPVFPSNDRAKNLPTMSFRAALYTFAQRRTPLSEVVDLAEINAFSAATFSRLYNLIN